MDKWWDGYDGLDMFGRSLEAPFVVIGWFNGMVCGRKCGKILDGVSHEIQDLPVNSSLNFSKKLSIEWHQFTKLVYRHH